MLFVLCMQLLYFLCVSIPVQCRAHAPLSIALSCTTTLHLDGSSVVLLKSKFLHTCWYADNVGMLIISGLFRKVNIDLMLLLPVRLVDPIVLPGSCCQLHIVLQWNGFWRFGLFFQHSWADDLLQVLLLSLLMFHCLIDVLLGLFLLVLCPFTVCYILWLILLSFWFYSYCIIYGAWVKIMHFLDLMLCRESSR